METESSPSREQALILLQLASLTSQLNGKPISPEFKEQIDRASQGDESIDVSKLLEQVSEELPDTSSAVDPSAELTPGKDPLHWTFDEGNRASCPAFSIAIPDGYRTIENYEDQALLTAIRPFVAVPANVADKDIPNADRIICAFTAVDRSEAFDANGLDELFVASKRLAQSERPIASCPHDWIVRAKNCDVVVERTLSGTTGFEYYIHPATKNPLAFLRLPFYNTDVALADDALPSVLAMAQTAEATPAVQSELLDNIERCRTELVDEDLLTDTLQRLYGAIALSIQWHSKGLFSQCGIRDEYDNATDALSSLLNDFDLLPERMVPYLDMFIGILEAQKRLGQDPLVLKAQQGNLEAMFGTVSINFTPSDADQARACLAHGPLTYPAACAALLERADALYPGIKATQKQALKDRAENLETISNDMLEEEDEDQQDDEDLLNNEHDEYLDEIKSFEEQYAEDRWIAEMTYIESLRAEHGSYRVQGTHKCDRKKRWEPLKAGDPVVLATDWNNEFYKPAAVEVLNLDGESLGYIDAFGGSSYSGTRDGHHCLPFLLPHCTATVADVKPSKTRYANASVALTVHAAFAHNGTLDWDFRYEIEEEAGRIMALPAEERPRLCSRRPEAAATQATSSEKPQAPAEQEPPVQVTPNDIEPLTVDYLGKIDSPAQPNFQNKTVREIFDLISVAQTIADGTITKDDVQWILEDIDVACEECLQRDIEAAFRSSASRTDAECEAEEILARFNSLYCSYLNEHVRALRSIFRPIANNLIGREAKNRATSICRCLIDHACRLEQIIDEEASYCDPDTSAKVTVGGIPVPNELSQIKKQISRFEADLADPVKSEAQRKLEAEKRRARQDAEIAQLEEQLAKTKAAKKEAQKAQGAQPQPETPATISTSTAEPGNDGRVGCFIVIAPVVAFATMFALGPAMAMFVLIALAIFWIFVIIAR